MVAVSAAQGWHIAELLESAFSTFPKEIQDVQKSGAINLAIVGRANVGKSSLVNYLLDDNRCIVSPIPGTTRDSVDIPFMYGDTEYNLIDTAGIRRKRAEHEVVDKFAAIRTERAIERADICVLMLDAQQGITTQDKKIANEIEEAGKGCIILFNKWDLVKGFRMEHCLKSIEEETPFLKHCPKLFISAKTGRNVEKLFDLVKETDENSKKRITTHQLNVFVGNALQRNHPPMVMGKRLRIYYMAQVAIEPPKFILFVNYPNLMTEGYRKYLYNQFREVYGFSGVPIELHLKGKKKAKEDRHQRGTALKSSDIRDGHPKAGDLEPEEYSDEGYTVNNDDYEDFSDDDEDFEED